MAKKKQGGAKKSSSSKASKSKKSKKTTKSSKKSKASKSSSKASSTEPTKSSLQSMTKAELEKYAKKFKIKLSTNDTKDEMVEAFLDEYDDLEEDEPKKKEEPLVHDLIPPHKKLSEKEKKEVQDKYHVDTLKMPKINVSDPAIQHMGAKEGDVIEITRKSQTAGEIKFYRSVVRD